jgi:hypothetical protein
LKKERERWRKIEGRIKVRHLRDGEGIMESTDRKECG